MSKAGIMTMPVMGVHIMRQHTIAIAQCVCVCVCVGVCGCADNSSEYRRISTQLESLRCSARLQGNFWEQLHHRRLDPRPLKRRSFEPWALSPKPTKKSISTSSFSMGSRPL
jgi:hypothetical protein